MPPVTSAAVRSKAVVLLLFIYCLLLLPLFVGAWFLFCFAIQYNLSITATLKNTPKMGFQSQLSLNTGQKYCRECSKRAVCNTFDLH